MKLSTYLAFIVLTTALQGCVAGSSRLGATSDLKSEPTIARSKNASLERAITKQETILKRAPHDLAALNTLAIAYIQKARETGDLAWYVKGRKTLQTAVEIEPESSTSLHNLAYVCTIFHEFGDAIKLANQAISIDPSDAEAHGVLADAYYEQGEYDSAAKSAQIMLDLKPNLASLSRGAQIRWIMGNPKGAMALMGQAIEAGGSYPENTAWCRVQLGTMAFQTGNVLQAEQTFESVLHDLPDYRHAQVGLAKVRVSQGRLDDATKLLEEATSGGTTVAYVLELADVYKKAGRDADAKNQIQRIAAMRDEHLQYGIAGDELVLGVALVDHGGDLPRAIELLAAEAKSHDSVSANSAYAWALLKNGQAKEAKAAISRAMRTNVQDALVWFRAARIEEALGNKMAARQLVAKVQSLNPNFSTLYSETLFASR